MVARTAGDAAGVADSVLRAARMEWSTRVVETEQHGKSRITAYYLAGLRWGWMRATASMLWSSKWCGAFAAWCYRDQLPVAIRQEHLASTYRLDRWCRENERRRVRSPEDLRPGDILVVGAKKSYGDHVALVVRVDVHASAVHTIEGNAQGELGDGTHTPRRQDGVVRRERWHEIRYGVRPLVSDLL